jgi:hypothetical protein
MRSNNSFESDSRKPLALKLIVRRHKMRSCVNLFTLGIAAMLVGCTSGSEMLNAPDQLPVAPVEKVELPTSESTCVAAGGEWILLGPQMIAHGCMLKANDGGKACSTSVQCQGECVERAEGSRCADYIDGCFEPTGHGTVTQCVN